VTFFTITLGPKRLELLRELLPKAGKIAMLVNPRSLNPDAKEVQEAARAVGQSVHVLDAASEGDVDTAFRSLAQERDDALIVVSDPLFTSRREQIVRRSILCANTSLPADSSVTAPASRMPTVSQEFTRVAF
jgi:putative ABC transport system substrate-binding protein